MKNFITLHVLACVFLLCFHFQKANAQTPSLLSQLTIGGSDDDEAQNTIKTKDGGYLNIGFASSSDDDFNVPSGHGRDAYAIKFDALGNKVWTKSFGSSGEDAFFSALQTGDGGYVLCGQAGANDGDVTGFHGGLHDGWVVRLSANGNVLWKKCYGGSNDDIPRDIVRVEGGFIICARSNSSDGDLTQNHGDYDGWIFKISNSGNLIWQHSYGGSSFDRIRGIATAPGNNYLMTGWTSSNDGDVNGNHGGQDFWWLKVDGNGNLIDTKCFGGTADDAGYSITRLSDGKFVIGGLTFSNDDDVSGNHGSADAWVVKTNGTGNILWQHCYGTTGYETAFGITGLSEGGFVGTGTAPNANGSGDVYAFSGDNDGNSLWETSYGGTDDDDGLTALELNDGNFLITAYERSADEDVINNHGNFDGWLLTLGFDGMVKQSSSLPDAIQVSMSAYPNPFSQATIISWNIAKDEFVAVKVFDEQGRLINILFEGNEKAGAHDCSFNAKDESGNALNTGVYFVKFQTANFSHTIPLTLIR